MDFDNLKFDLLKAVKDPNAPFPEGYEDLMEKYKLFMPVKRVSLARLYQMWDYVSENEVSASEVAKKFNYKDKASVYQIFKRFDMVFPKKNGD